MACSLRYTPHLRSTYDEREKNITIAGVESRQLSRMYEQLRKFVSGRSLVIQGYSDGRKLNTDQTTLFLSLVIR